MPFSLASARPSFSGCIDRSHLSSPVQTLHWVSIKFPKRRLCYSNTSALLLRDSALIVYDRILAYRHHCISSPSIMTATCKDIWRVHDHRIQFSYFVSFVDLDYHKYPGLPVGYKLFAYTPCPIARWASVFPRQHVSVSSHSEHCRVGRRLAFCTSSTLYILLAAWLFWQRMYSIVRTSEGGLHCGRFGGPVVYRYQDVFESYSGHTFNNERAGRRCRVTGPVGASATPHSNNDAFCTLPLFPVSSKS